MKKRIWGFAATAAALAALVATPASAHRQWMMPSSTVLSGDDVWVTVDAAVSNDLFYFEHQPLRLDAMKAWAPMLYLAARLHRVFLSFWPSPPKATAAAEPSSYLVR